MFVLARRSIISLVRSTIPSFIYPPPADVGWEEDSKERIMKMKMREQRWRWVEIERKICKWVRGLIAWLGQELKDRTK
jgi:hypothetical protein